MASPGKAVQLAQHPVHGMESRLPYNIGIMVAGDPAPGTSASTIVVTGTPRGGTTMVAEFLDALGLPMGTAGLSEGNSTTKIRSFKDYCIARNQARSIRIPCEP